MVPCVYINCIIIARLPFACWYCEYFLYSYTPCYTLLRKLHVVKRWHSTEVQWTIILVKFNTGHHCTATNDCYNMNLTQCSWASQPTIKNPHLESPEVTHTKVIIIVQHNHTMGERVAKVETRKQCVNYSQ